MSTTRLRVIDERVAEHRDYNTVFNYAPFTFHDDQITGYTGKKVTIQDNNNKGFRKIQRAGGVVLSDCVITRWERTMTPTLITAATPPDGSVWRGTDYGDHMSRLRGDPALPPLTVTVANSNVLLMKAYANMNASGVMSGESLATLGQTISMLRHPLKGASDLLVRMHKSRKLRLGKTTASAARATADTWLEYRYGWTPLILDTKEIIKKSHKLREKCEVRRLVARAGDSASISDSKSWSCVVVGSDSFSGSRTFTKTVRCGVGVLYEVRNRTTSDELAALFGTRLRDIPATIWELVPYSFVIDWFTNVGDWLQAITPDPGVVPLGHWISSVDTSTLKRSGRYEWSNPSEHLTEWAGDLGSEEITNFTFSRSCNTPITFTPGLTGVSLSILHQADAAALSLKPILGQLRKFRH